MIRVLAPLPVLLPMLAAGLTLVLGHYPRLQRAIALVVLSAVLAVSGALLVYTDRSGESASAVTVGGWPATLGITLMVDVTRMPDNSFGSVPTPAIVAPIEFSMRLVDYKDLGGHMERVRTVQDIMQSERVRVVGWDGLNPWPIGRE